MRPLRQPLYDWRHGKRLHRRRHALLRHRAPGLDRDSQDIACYRLLVGIEAAIALCYHVTTRRLRTAPEDYAACFVTLCDAGLIAQDLSDRLPRMARFRNLLVHMYWKLDYNRVYDIMQTDLGDLRRFSAGMAALI